MKKYADTFARSIKSIYRSPNSVDISLAVALVIAILFLLWLIPALLVWATAALFGTAVTLSWGSWTGAAIFLLLVRGSVITHG